MKVLFVASGNKRVGEVSSFVQSQYDSLKAGGLEMMLFPVVGHGALAHLKAAWQLRKIVRREKPDVIHAHYSVYGYVAALATMCMCHKPEIVVSILGSFPRRNKKWRLVRYCVQNVWDKTIVKSERTKRQLGLDVPVIPNGVNLEIFQTLEASAARKAVGFEDGKKYIIWCSNPERPEKDWPLAEAAVKQLQITNNKNEVNRALAAEKYQISLVPVFNKTPQEVCTYMNAADCLLLTSVSEGSPNVIKEAMACNCPIVTTDVGDVTERLENLEGCYVVDSREPKELAEALRKSLAFGKRTEGRKRIIADQLEISQIAKRIKDIYERI